jgi:WXG100 family type VII secretion target
MAARIVRADYDQLTQMASAFTQQADQARQMLQQLSKQSEALQRGDWLGQGAQAFYAEMNGQVLPTMNRLVRALEAAGDVTRQVNQIVQQAESEAAACLRVNGNGAGATIAAAAAGLGLNGGGGAAGPAGPGASALFGGPAGPKAGGSAKAPTLKERLASDPKLASQLNHEKALLAKLQRLEREGWTIDLMTGKMGKSDPTFLASNGPPGTISLNPDRPLEGLRDASNDILYGDMKILNKLDPKVANQAMQDPLLMEQLRQLDKAGWTIALSEKPGDAAMVHSRKEIVLDSAHPTRSLYQSVREAVRGPELPDNPEYPIETTGRFSYVRQNVLYHLDRDAAELISKASAYQAVHGKLPDTLPFTSNGKVSPRSEQYKEMVQKVSAGTLTAADARFQMKVLLSEEPSSIGNAIKYQDRYGEKYDKWQAEQRLQQSQPPQRPR